MKPIISATIIGCSLAVMSQQHLGDPVLVGIRFEPWKRPTSIFGIYRRGKGAESGRYVAAAYDIAIIGGHRIPCSLSVAAMAFGPVMPLAFISAITGESAIARAFAPAVHTFRAVSPTCAASTYRPTYHERRDRDSA